MENWRLVCLLAVLAALLPVETIEAAGGPRRGEGKGGCAGRVVLPRERGPVDFGI